MRLNRSTGILIQGSGSPPCFPRAPGTGFYGEEGRGLPPAAERAGPHSGPA
ncbi:MAG: hypothetical protein ABII74_10300 [Elusimicrobiota bacterium]